MTLINSYSLLWMIIMSFDHHWILQTKGVDFVNVPSFVIRCNCSRYYTMVSICRHFMGIINHVLIRLRLVQVKNVKPLTIDWKDQRNIWYNENDKYYWVATQQFVSVHLSLILDFFYFFFEYTIKLKDHWPVLLKSRIFDYYRFHLVSQWFIIFMIPF